MYSREDVLGMVAGPELDELIERVVFETDPATGYNHYSRNMGDAWEVVEQMNDRHAFEVGRAGDICAPDDKWRARIGMSGWVEEESAPLAIVKAALLSLLKED